MKATKGKKKTKQRREVAKVEAGVMTRKKVESTRRRIKNTEERGPDRTLKRPPPPAAAATLGTTAEVEAATRRSVQAKAKSTKNT